MVVTFDFQTAKKICDKIANYVATISYEFKIMGI